jgi:hypothetical protein
VRRALAVTAVLLAAVAGISLIPSPAPAQARSKDWICTLGGTLVAAGVGAATAGITGVLAGGGFTAGCMVGEPSSGQATMISGLPRVHNGCWWVFPRGNRKKKFEECVA